MRYVIIKGGKKGALLADRSECPEHLAELHGEAGARALLDKVYYAEKRFA